MPIAIILRKKLDVCLFRDVILNAIDAGEANEVVITSGFFQEEIGKYQATREPGFIDALVNNKVHLDIVGVHSNQWLPRFADFRDLLLINGVSVKAWRKKGDKWHAKICLLSRSGSPLMAVVGSSNITSRAFGVAGGPPNSNSPYPPTAFNAECDTVLWRYSTTRTGIAVSRVLDNDSYATSVIHAAYSPRRNFGITMKKRLSLLREEIFGSGLKPFD